MLETHIARGTADEAAEVLERVVETHDDDNELVSMPVPISKQKIQKEQSARRCC